MKSKASSRARAADLYISPLWRARRGYAESRKATWFILSAKYGLVAPQQMLDPYEMSLTELSAYERERWGLEAVSDLEAKVGDLRGRVAEVVADHVA